MATAIKINRLTPEQAAYLAGLIDGEGTITLRYRRGFRYGSERRLSTQSGRFAKGLPTQLLLSQRSFAFQDFVAHPNQCGPVFLGSYTPTSCPS